jgi:hypothetical protein
VKTTERIEDGELLFVMVQYGVNFKMTGSCQPVLSPKLALSFSTKQAICI